MKWQGWRGIALLSAGCAAAHASPAPASAAGNGVMPAQTHAAAHEAAGPVPGDDRSELRVGTSGDYAPFSIGGSPGTVGGFDAELAQAMAEDLGFRLRWVTFRWSTLPRELADGRFDVAMAGITWQPARAVVGYMTRAVARGGPCLLGDPNASRVAVNRGGVLETWSRAHLSDREVVLVDDNQSLPDLLATARVGAIVTDSFEQRTFRRPSWALTCEPPLARKVYWVGPGRPDLGPRIDGWIVSHRGLVQAAQDHWFGERQQLDDLTDLVDLLARRMAFMPLVADLKTRRGLPVEDVERERVVVDRAAASARARGLPDQPVRRFFEVQIELSKAVERRMRESSVLDLEQQIRPALNELGTRIVEDLAKAREAHLLARCTLADLELLSPWLNASERALLLARLQAFD